MVAEPARDQIPEWDGRADILERFEEDVLIFTHAVPKEHKVTIGPKLLQQLPKGTPQRKIGLELLKSGMLQLEDGATQLLNLIRLRLRKYLQQDVSEHYKRFLHRSARLYQQSVQHYIAEESNLHERALQAVRSVSSAGMGGTETKEIIADVLRAFLLLENAALTGSKQVFVFGVAGKSYAHKQHFANALRETWGNDERLRSHVSALLQQLQGKHLAGGAHLTGEKTSGRKQTTITKGHWIRGLFNGMTPRNMMMSTIRKRPTGPRITTRPAITTRQLRQCLAIDTFLVFKLDYFSYLAEPNYQSKCDKLPIHRDW